MKNIFETRLLFWKFEWKGLLFWLTFPLLVTIIIMFAFGAIEEEANVPVGVVLEDDSILAKQLYESIQSTPYVKPFLLDEREAINQLEKQQLDSVFVIQKHFDENIERGRKNNLIKSYSSNLSFTYVPLKELVISYVNGDFTRAQAAFTVEQLYEQYDVENDVNWHELIERSKVIEREQNLLKTSLTFFNSDVVEKGEQSIIDPWTIWVFATFLCTLFIFDWVIKENNKSIQNRLLFSKWSKRYYFALNGLIYTVLMFIIDIVTIIILAIIFNFEITFYLMMTLISYRVTLNMFAFLFSFLFKSVYSFYMISFALLCASLIMSGIIVPIDGLISQFPAIVYFNPFHPVLTINPFNYWFIIAILLCFVSFIREEKQHA